MSSSVGADEFGGFWIRVVATLIDSVLLLVIILPINLAVYGREYFDSTALFVGPVDYLVTWVFPTIAVILFWINRAATPGKMAVGLRIADARTGQNASPGQLVGRYFGYFVSLLAIGVGFLWVAWDPKKQGFHDKLAGTVVIRRTRRQEQPSFEKPV